MRNFFTFLFISFITIGFVSGQAAIPFSYGGTWGSLSMSGGNLTSNNAASYSSGSEHRMDAVNHFVQLRTNPLSSGTFSVKLVAKTGGGAWSGELTLQESTDGVSWADLSSITVIGNNNIFVTPSVSITSGTAYFRVIYTNRVSGSNIGVDDFSITGTVLPVEFAKFTASNKGTTNLLDFTTASEINNDYFTIERASNGGAFEALGTIKGAGDSRAEIRYTYTDENPSAGINHYRIMQTDYDGKYSYSAVRSVRNTLDGKLVISPRTTEGKLSILTDLENYDISVYDLSGQQVYQSSNHSADVDINIDNVRAGIYLVKVTNGYTTEVTKIVKI